ncbi:MAG: hypothetical protein INR66_03030 [Gordonia polyisoprenivorans]|nr:hypothetical protein [Gordonia polyisoprenivorans]
MDVKPPGDITDREDSTGDLFQLHTIDDIRGEVLAEPGTLLREFFPEGRVYSVTAGLSAALREIPATGWRLIQHRDNERLQRDTIAAPSAMNPGSWIVLYSSRGEDGRWIISTGGEGWTFPAVPARSVRRRPLRLELGTTTTQAGSSPLIYPTLTNVSEANWRNVAEDSPTVLVWVLDDDGNPIFEPGFVVWGSSGLLPDLAPGESTTLYAAQVETAGVETFAPGTYRVTGLLKSLGLQSEPGVLLIE